MNLLQLMKSVWKSSFVRYSVYIAGAVLLATGLFPNFGHQLLSTGMFMPHATCYLRDPAIIWLHVTADLAIGTSYVCIALTLAYLVFKASHGIPYHWVFLAFGTFIISCGFTHFMEVVTVWTPLYWLAGYIKVITAVASLVTALALFPLVPKVFRAVAEVKAAEERRFQLEKAHAELEKANVELADQTGELRLANRDLEMFAYSIAHDLKGPARAVEGFCSVLAEEHAPSFNAEGRALIQRIVQASTRMDSLLRDLLAYTNVSRAGVELTTISLEAFWKEALAMVEIERVEKQATIDVLPTSLRVRASSTLLLQALVNLISNAMKYVPPGTRPEVRIWAESRGPVVRIWVEDNGIGVEPNQQERIFGMFVRLHSSYEGTGVGLAIARRAVERMGGRVGLESAVGKGSRFWLEVEQAGQ